MSEPEPDQENMEYAYSRLWKAQSRLEPHRKSHEEGIEGADEEMSEEVEQMAKYTNKEDIISDCQYCIELPVKSMHKMIGTEFQTKHGLEFTHGNTQAFVTHVPDDFPYKNKIPRAIFLTQFWDGFYQLSKYGAPEIDKDPEAILHWKDAKRAVEDAIFCLSLAFHFLDYVVGNYEVDDPRPDQHNIDFSFDSLEEMMDPYSLTYDRE